MGKNIDNTYSTDVVSSSADDILNAMKGLVEKVDNSTVLNEFADKRNICNDEFIKMLSSGNIYEHTKESYDDKYDTEVITEEQDIDDNGRSFIPVTIKVYKKGDTVAYIRKENVYPVTIFDNGEEVEIILTNDKYIMMDIYPTSGPQTTKYNTMLEPPDKFNTKKLTTMYRMFSGCEKMEKVDVSNFDTSNVFDMESMFGYFYNTSSGDVSGCRSLLTLDVSNFDTSNVRGMNRMFRECWNLTTLDLSKWDTSNVRDMSEMFRECSSLTTLDLSKWDTSNVTDMSEMFMWCHSLTTLYASNWDTSNVTDMSEMFYGCNSLTTLYASNWDTSNVTNMREMFSGCSSLTILDLLKWDTSNVTDMNYIFAGCENLTTITGVIDMKSCTYYTNMFTGCDKLTGVKLKNVPTGFDASKAGLKAGQYTIIS